MFVKRGIYFIISILALVSVSCSQYHKISKSQDYKFKYEKAMEYYEREDYFRALGLFDQVIPFYRGTEEAERRLVDAITIADGKMPVYILDQDYKLIRTLKPGDPSPIMIDPNEFFIVGSYLMRFHQEKPQAMMTSDATQLRRAGAMTAR